MARDRTEQAVAILEGRPANEEPATEEPAAVESSSEASHPLELVWKNDGAEAIAKIQSGLEGMDAYIRRERSTSHLLVNSRTPDSPWRSAER